MTGMIFLFSCEKKEAEPVLDMSLTKAPVITKPADGSAYVLKQDSAENVFTTFQWTAAEYSLEDIETVKYSVQMDIADSNFKNVKNLVATDTVAYTFKIGGINQNLIAMKVPTDSATDIAFRVLSYINNETEYTYVYSDVITLNIRPYKDVVTISPIYLLGNGTTVGWDNSAALEMTHIEKGEFAIVEHLTPGADHYIKFIANLGQWAPQWGTDESGTAEEGPLVYRPDEGVPDPLAIPVGDTEGNYYIIADTAGLEYETLLTSGELYLVGDATTAGWDNANGIPFVQNPDTLTKFTLVTTLNADGGMKFLEVLGEWAPQWGTDEDGTGETGTLVYRPTESVPDPTNIPAPGAAGEYMIEANLRTMTYTIISQ